MINDLIIALVYGRIFVADWTRFKNVTTDHLQIQIRQLGSGWIQVFVS